MTSLSPARLVCAVTALVALGACAGPALVAHPRLEAAHTTQAPTVASTTAPAAPTTATPPASTAPVADLTPARTAVGTSAPRPTVLPCAALPATVSSQDDAAGHAHVVIAFANEARLPCRTQGYPGLVLTDAAGHPVTMVVSHGSDVAFPRVPAATVLVQPGGHASFDMGFSRIPDAGAQACVSGRSIVVTAPGVATSTTLPLEVAACGPVVVSPIMSGSAGSAR